MPTPNRHDMACCSISALPTDLSQVAAGLARPLTLDNGRRLLASRWCRSTALQEKLLAQFVDWSAGSHPMAVESATGEHRR